MDSNITTLITALVLYEYGTGPIKGFAVTFSLGILTSVFAALVLTRLLYEHLPGRPSRRRACRSRLQELLRVRNHPAGYQLRLPRASATSPSASRSLLIGVSLAAIPCRRHPHGHRLRGRHRGAAPVRSRARSVEEGGIRGVAEACGIAGRHRGALRRGDRARVPAALPRGGRASRGRRHELPGARTRTALGSRRCRPP